jgi:hypothetical protein
LQTQGSSVFAALVSLKLYPDRGGSFLQTRLHRNVYVHGSDIVSVCSYSTLAMLRGAY